MPNNYPCWFACLNVKLNRDVILNSLCLCWFSTLNIKLAGGGNLYSQYRCWSSQLNVKCNASTRRDDGFIQRHGLSSPSGPLGPSGPLSPWSRPVGARWSPLGPLGPLGPSGPSGPLSPNLGKDYSQQYQYCPEAEKSSPAIISENIGASEVLVVYWNVNSGL